MMHRFEGNAARTTGGHGRGIARLGGFFGFVLCVMATPVMAATFVVNSTGDGADAVPGNGVCADGSGNCTLRAAITEANSTTTTDTINFGIGTGAKTINVLTQLDAVTETVTINGTSQPGFSTVPLIQVTGPGAGNADGLTINADNCVVRGLVLNGFGRGVSITGSVSHLIAQGNVVAGCYIGTNAAGTAIAAVPNAYGILLADNGSVVGSGAQGNTIGGLTASDRNVISGNSSHTGIIIGGSISSGNVIEGNYIGTNAAGTGAVPNSYVGGIWILSPDNVIGGVTPNARNVISGNSNGVFLGGSNAHGNRVEGNYIGTDASGTAALGNGSSGVIIGDDTQNPNSGAHDNIIGGSATGAGNLISGNSIGVSIGNGFTADNTTGNVVQGNRIGTNAAGTGAVANNFGVVINGGAKDNRIGGTATGAGNTIAFNASDGVNVGINAGLTATGTSIRGNAIYGNGGLGINLQPANEASNAVTPNDALDADIGPNTLQNFPILSVASGNTTATTISGTLNSTPNQTFSLDFFSNPSADPSGNGEGQTYLGNPPAATVTTNASGNASFSVTFNSNLLSRFITATATSSTGGNTSEFSKAIEVPPALSVNNPRSLPEGSAATPGSVTFDITLNAASTQTVTVSYQTTTGNTNPAIAGSDYVAKSGTLTFAPGQTLKRITIFFIGDSVPELNETFFFDLKTPTNATIADSRGVGQINNDDGPSITIANAAAINEGNSSTTPQTFAVTLSAASANTVTVNWATADGTATTADYVAASGTLTFAPGETSKIITVQVKGDTTVEPSETYKVNLSKPTYAVIADSQGIGTIHNDDAAQLSFQNDEPSQ